MELTLMKENEDGSADFDLSISPLEVQALVNLGLIQVLKQAIEEGKKYVPASEPSMGDSLSGTKNCVYGPCVKSGQSRQPCVCSETSQVPY